MDGLRTEANAETDALYPAEWIDAQREPIMRRTRTSIIRPSVTFPGRLVTQQIAKGIELRVSPWAATAAAACLFVGVALGMIDARNHLPRYAIVRAVPGPTAVQATAPCKPSQSDTDAFLSELERALVGSAHWSSQ